jgi:hypothetical protein
MWRREQTCAKRTRAARWRDADGAPGAVRAGLVAGQQQRQDDHQAEVAECGVGECHRRSGSAPVSGFLPQWSANPALKASFRIG